MPAALAPAASPAGRSTGAITPHPDRHRHPGHDLVGREVEVRVGQHDRVVRRRRAPGPACRARWRSRGCTWRPGRADERHRVHAGVGQQRVDGLAVAVHDVEHALAARPPRPAARRASSTRTVLLGRLEHECVARGQRQREHPARDHRGEVERGDPGDDADRLAQREAVDAAGNLPGVLTLEQLGRPQANSTSSSSRWTSPWASPVTLPCSMVTIRAISSRRACSSSRNANMIYVRFDSDADSHAGAPPRPPERRHRPLRRRRTGPGPPPLRWRSSSPPPGGPSASSPRVPRSSG